MGHILFVCFTTALLLILSEAAIGDDCTTQTCPDNMNLMCDDNTKKCVCVDGFEEKNSVCTLTVSSTTCTTEADQCPNIDNSICESNKCKCIPGYIEDIDTCTKAIGNDCTSQTCPENMNLLCDDNTKKCICAGGFEEKNSVCTLTVSSTTCTTESDRCPNIDNSICESTKCKCIAGYIEDIDTCTKAIGYDCTSQACPDNMNLLCDDNTKKCGCAGGFEEKNSVCTLTVSSTTCTTETDQCPNIDNSICESNKCKCIAGYIEDIDMCTKDDEENSASSIVLVANMMSVPLLVTLNHFIFS